MLDAHVLLPAMTEPPKKLDLRSEPRIFAHEPVPFCEEASAAFSKIAISACAASSSESRSRVPGWRADLTACAGTGGPFINPHAVHDEAPDRRAPPSAP